MNDSDRVAMTDEELDDDVTEKMIQLGGSFVAALGALYRKADPINRATLKAAFPGYWAMYLELARQTRERASRQRNGF